MAIATNTITSRSGPKSPGQRSRSPWRDRPRFRLASGFAGRIVCCLAISAATLVAIHGLTPVALLPVAAASLLLLGRLGPRAGEPPVHDRQLDYLVSGAFFAAALWFAWAWPGDNVGVSLTGRACLLAGAVTLCLGTRNATRLWPSFLALGVLCLVRVLPWWAFAGLVVAAAGGCVVQLRRRERVVPERTGVPRLPLALIAVIIVAVLVALPSLAGDLL